MASQSLDNIVQVSVTVSATTPAANALNVGLIVGTSTVIPTTTRTVSYGSTADMTTAGWTGIEPEFKAAQLYFDQVPTPAEVVIGRQDLTATESILAAVTACRTSNNLWYGVYACGAADADIEAVAAYVQSLKPVSTYFYDTQDAAITSGTAGNVMETLQTAKDSRSIGIFSTTAYAGAAMLGAAMGLNTGLSNFAFTLALKPLVGVAPETLTSIQVATILGYNGNVYTTYGNNYNLLANGRMADGTPFDQVLNIDIMATNVQIVGINALVSNVKIAQTDTGVALIVNELSAYFQTAVKQGILAPGVWNGGQVLGLSPGTALPNGFIVLADTIANQSASDISARKSPPIYCCCKLAGALEDLVIGLAVSN